MSHKNEHIKFTQAENGRTNLLIDIKDMPLDSFCTKLQDNFKHHGITGLNLTPVIDHPGIYTLSWKTNTTGIRKILSALGKGEKERVQAAVRKLGGTIDSKEKSLRI